MFSANHVLSTSHAQGIPATHAFHDKHRPHLVMHSKASAKHGLLCNQFDRVGSIFLKSEKKAVVRQILAKPSRYVFKRVGYDEKNIL